jgi:hypothetical protein
MKKNRIFRLVVLGVLFLGSIIAQWLTCDEGPQMRTILDH